MGILHDVFERQAATHRDRMAVGGPREVLTYGQLAEAAAEFARGLRQTWATLAPAGWPDPADRPRVVISAANSPRYVAAYLGCLRAGAVPLLLDPVLGPQEIDAVIGSCGIDLLVHDRELPLSGLRDAGELGGLSVTSALAYRPAGSVRPDLHPDTEVCRFTSGSTGMPSCIEFSGTAVLNAATAWNEASGTGPDDRILCFAGLFNGLAFNTSLLPAFLAGAALWLPSGMPSAGHVARFLREIRPSRLTGFPALYDSLLRRDIAIPELAALTVALSSAAPLSTETRAALLARHDLAVCNYYGVAETGPLTFDPDPAPDAGLGFPLPGAEFDFGPAGDLPGAETTVTELRVRSRSMGTRYLNVPGHFERRRDADGWFHTGDEGFLRDGRLFLAGRTGKAINIGGRKIDAAEVRTALLSVPGTVAVAVFTVEKGNGDPMLVAALSGPVMADPAQLRAHCLGRLAPYKVPERFLVVPEMPVTSLGKPRMSALRELARGRGPAT
ncbi:class I adenylate-forming enzyme family protein [Plantactinospora sp. ZYX-F-223]|uniref:class I adenylate-forming enzyme family protein n=1 Tax=Plantactinospora sp. ZYX-F-223 TaxID=3144103 RepID=UPI0031FC0329